MKKEAAAKLKTVKVSEEVHSKLKIHVAEKRIKNITSFVDAAILEKIRTGHKIG